jgi:hypothetical protein
MNELTTKWQKIERLLSASNFALEKEKRIKSLGWIGENIIVRFRYEIHPGRVASFCKYHVPSDE